MLKKSFTLIELLIVIAIIAILAGMLLPALNKAREKGRSASCVNRMKQVGLAMNFYQDDNGGFVPILIDPNTGKCWLTMVTDAKYLDTIREHNICPTLLAMTTLHTQYITAINSCLNGNGAYFKNSQARTPSRLFFITGDAWYRDNPTDKFVDSPFNTWSDDIAIGNIWIPRFYACHGNVGNMLFFDGHVNGLGYKDIPLIWQSYEWDPAHKGN